MISKRRPDRLMDKLVLLPSKSSPARNAPWPRWPVVRTLPCRPVF